MKTFAFFYLMKEEPEAIKEVAPKHVSYWKELQLEAYEGGPFEDRSGGLIIFKADDREAAMQIVKSDPFYEGHLLHTRFVKEWMKE